MQIDKSTTEKQASLEAKHVSLMRTKLRIEGWGRSYNHPAVCPTGSKMDCQHRAGPQVYLERILYAERKPR